MMHLNHAILPLCVTEAAHFTLFLKLDRPASASWTIKITQGDDRRESISHDWQRKLDENGWQNVV
jgi:hypothetical protein